jgi:cytochrome P450
MLDHWRSGETLDVHEELLHLSVRIATKTLAEEEAGGDEDGSDAERTLLDAVALLASPLTQLAPHELPGLPYRCFLDLVGRFDGQMRQTIARKRAFAAEERDVLSMLISARDEESGAALTEDELLVTSAPSSAPPTRHPPTPSPGRSSCSPSTRACAVPADPP